MPPTVVDVQLHFILVRQNKSMFPRVKRAPPGIAPRPPPGGAPHYLRRTALGIHGIAIRDVGLGCWTLAACPFFAQTKRGWPSHRKSRLVLSEGFSPFPEVSFPPKHVCLATRSDTIAIRLFIHLFKLI